jgi:hypothetical protein
VRVARVHRIRRESRAGRVLVSRLCARLGAATLAVLALLVALICAAVGTTAPVAATSAPFWVTVTASPSTLNYPRERSYVLRFRVANGSRSDRIEIGFAYRGWPDRVVFGSAWSYGKAWLVGPGHLRQLVAAARPIDVCVRSGAETDTLLVNVPANRTTTVVQRVRIAAPPLCQRPARRSPSRNQ